MPDIKITNKDITIAILIVLVAFVGIPLTVWGYSNWRINQTVKKVTPEIKQIIESNLPDAKLLIQSISDEYTSKPAGTDIYSRNSYLASKRLTKEACGDISNEISGNAVLGEVGIHNFYYNGCNFLYISSEENINLSVNESRVNEKNRMDKEYKEHLDEMLVSVNELPMNIHPHRDQRSIHVVTLLNQEPVLLLDIIMRMDSRLY